MWLDIFYISMHVFATLTGVITLTLGYRELAKAKKIINYFMHILKMDINIETIIDDITGDTTEGVNAPDNSNEELIATYRQRLAEVVSGGRSKDYLGKPITLEQLWAMPDKEVLKMYAIYEAKLGAQMTASLGQTFISLYSSTISRFISIDDQHKLTKDLSDDPLIKASINSLTSHLYFKYGAILAPIAAAMITYNHVEKNPLDHIKTEHGEKKPRNSATDSNYPATDSNCPATDSNYPANTNSN